MDSAAMGDQMSATAFGQIDQAPVFEVTIASQAGASAKILTYGAVVRDLVVPASNGLQRVVLGLNTLDDYLKLLAVFRRGSGTVRQPDRQRPVCPRRSRL